MHVQTHILSGWCLGNLPALTARERALCMVAAALPDLDGLGILISDDWYWNLHHIVGHNLFFGILLSATLAAFSSSRLKAFLIYLGLFHLHLAMDFVGSGPDWGLAYLWPVSHHQWKTDWVWPLFSWQNLSAFALLLLWTWFIIRRHRRTPLEWIMPRLDRQLTALLSPAMAGGEPAPIIAGDDGLAPHSATAAQPGESHRRRRGD